MRIASTLPSTQPLLTVEQVRAERIALGLPPDKPVFPCYRDKAPDREHYRAASKEAFHAQVP